MDNYIFFCSHNKKDGTEIFSQWYPLEFEEDGQKYHNCEQYMMAGKAKLCNDLESLDKILQIYDPRKMKKIFGISRSTIIRKNLYCINVFRFN